MQDFKVAVATCLKEHIEELTLEEITALIEVPPNKDMGDFAFPCFKLARPLPTIFFSTSLKWYLMLLC